MGFAALAAAAPQPQAGSALFGRGPGAASMSSPPPPAFNTGLRLGAAILRPVRGAAPVGNAFASAAAATGQGPMGQSARLSAVASMQGSSEPRPAAAALSVDDVAAFAAEKFVAGRIPVAPPPREVCF